MADCRFVSTFSHILFAVTRRHNTTTTNRRVVQGDDADAGAVTFFDTLEPSFADGLERLNDRTREVQERIEAAVQEEMAADRAAAVEEIR